MKQTYKFAAGVAALGLGMAVAAANAQPGQMGAGTGPHMQGGMQLGAMAGMQHARGQAQHGMTGGPRHGVTGSGAAGQGVGQALTTQEERSAIIEKMRNAGTPEERLKIAEEHRAEMDKRAREKGISLPAHRGPHFGGMRHAPTTN